MITLKRTNADDEDFRALVKYLDAELKDLDGEEHAFYAQLNTLGTIRHAIVAYNGDVPVGCGAIRKFNEDTMEVKRMFVPFGQRGKGIAGAVLQELEKWSKELNCQACVLETSTRQPAAIRLYEKSGYKRIANYGAYAVVESSVCFEKQL